MSYPLRNQPPDPRISELEDYAAEVFGGRDAAEEWLNTPLWELDNLSPREIVARGGDAAVERVRDVLLRIEYGVYS